MAKNLLPDLPLTEPDRTMRDRRRLTVPGMASWGGEGPLGHACHQCTHWKADGYRISNGQLRPGECQKYTAMMGGKRGPRVPPMTATCRYFRLDPKSLPLYDDGRSWP